VAFDELMQETRPAIVALLAWARRLAGAAGSAMARSQMPAADRGTSRTVAAIAAAQA